MKQLRQIVTTIHGSHLYGTSTPTSDEDYKGVHLPSGQGIILQAPENVVDTSIEAKDAAGKNTGEAIDRQSYSLQKMCALIAAGDTVATEILFAPNWAIVEQDDLWPTMRLRMKQLINGDVSSYAAYCLKQASKYGVKGGRMAALRALLDVLDPEMANNAKAKVATIKPRLEDLAAQHELVSLVLHQKGENTAEMLKCCDRQVPLTASIEQAHKIYTAIWVNYGARSRLALSNEGIDWKALSHAVRVARQARELITTANIVFPRPDAEELLAIKAGKLEYLTVAALLEDLVEKLRETQGILQMETPATKVDEIVYDYYRRQI